MMTEDATLTQVGDKLYATARAFIVESEEDLPREIAADTKMKLNPSFVWIAGRYVQGNKANKNGHYWTFDDLQRGEYSIKYTPMNALHKWDQPVGTLVETKLIHREEAVEGEDRMLPEIQALGVLWAANFPTLAKEVREAHEQKTLWWSMECVAEAKQCLVCGKTYPYAAQASDVCEHLASNASAPRRFINPTFLGGALIYPPERPAWPEADITEVAKELTLAYAMREEAPQVDPRVVGWEEMMHIAMEATDE